MANPDWVEKIRKLPEQEIRLMLAKGAFRADHKPVALAIADQKKAEGEAEQKKQELEVTNMRVSFFLEQI